MRWLPLAALLALAACATPPACLLPRQSRMLNVELYMGSDIAGHAPLSAAAWDGFVAREIATRFPDGFTVLNATGQWLSPNSGQIGREASHLVRIWTPPSATLAPRIEAISAAYKTQFRQEAVGVTITEGCGRFSE